MTPFNLCVCVCARSRDLKKSFLLMPALQYIARNWPYWNATNVRVWLEYLLFRIACVVGLDDPAHQ